MMGGRWRAEQEGYSVALKELLAVEKALEKWGDRWKGKRVRFSVDSMNVTSFWRRGGARKGKLQYAQVMKRVVRVLWEMEVRMVDVVWTPRELNELADRMSKLHLRVPLWVRRDAPWDGGWRSEDWGLVHGLKKWIMARVGRIGLDAYASRTSAVVENFRGPFGTDGARGEAQTAEEWGWPSATCSAAACWWAPRGRRPLWIRAWRN